jgi:S-adenosylmethionine synthetase
VACEVLVTTGTCIVAGEITTTTYVDVPRIARSTIDYVGYNDATYGFDAHTCGVHQPDSVAVAGHFDGRGYRRRGRPGHDVRLRLRRDARADAAADHDGAQAGAAPLQVRREGMLDFLRPDGKSQVSVEYVGGVPKRIDAVVISTQHSAMSASKSCAAKSRSTSSTR